MQAGVPSEEGGLGRRRHACGGFPEGTDWFSRHQTWRKDPHYLSRRWTTKDIQYVRWIDEWRASAVTEKLFIELHACTFCFSPEPSRKGMPQSHGGRNQSRGRTILNLVKIMSWNCCVEPCRDIFILSIFIETLHMIWFLTGGHQNGAARFAQAGPQQHHQPQQQREVTYSMPIRNPPPSSALPKLGSQKNQRGSRPAQNQSTNRDFLNVPDQGMSG